MEPNQRDLDVATEYLNSIRADQDPDRQTATFFAAYRVETESRVRAEERMACANRAWVWLVDNGYIHNGERMDLLRAAIMADTPKEEV